ncbi:MAG: phosphate ABC transporter ATP-binding protein, partial [Haloarculaceae archaeon]
MSENNTSTPDPDSNDDQLVETAPGRGGLAERDDTSSGESHTVIETRNLDVYYGDTQALQDVSMEVPSNRV